MTRLDAETRPVAGHVLELPRRLLRAEYSSVLIATIGLAAVMGIIHPQFLSGSQLVDILQQSVYVAFLALGLCLLIAMREIDLSVGAIFGLTLVSGAVLMRDGVDPGIAALLALGFGGVLGAVNSFATAAIRIQSLMATLATASLFRGIAIGETTGQQVVNLPIEHEFFTVLGGKWNGIPVSVVLLVIAVVIVTFLVRRTPFGYRLRNIGSNPDAAEFSGISIRNVRTQAMVISGVLAAVGGLCALSYFNSGDPTAGTGLELNAVAAAIIGGTPLRGGTCSPIGAVLGAVLLTVVSSGLVYFNVPATWSQAVTGAVILLALGFDSAMRSLRGNRGRD